MDEERYQEKPESISSSHQKNPQRQKPVCNDKVTEQLKSVRAPNSKLFKIYYLNRQKVYNWIIKQSKRLKLQIQTLANTICLADKYFMHQELQPALFKKIGLVLMIISTKSLQQSILYTQTIAKNNQVPFQELLALQYNILLKFDFQIGQHNYVKTAHYYMQKWDMIQKQEQQPLYFLRDDQKSYVRYQKVLFLCYKFHLQFGNDLEVNIVCILKETVLLQKQPANCQKSFNQLQDKRKKEPFETLPQQFNNACSPLSLEEIEQIDITLLQSKIRTKVQEWSNQLQDIGKNAQSKYLDEREKYKDYETFINVPL